MDIRGVEITNQLRSAIRAKLLELGVRYDDELPDYILVMVVNKKSRSQMNEDLNLFLEDNTETFVNWLHDQVLKKLQKVTVAKKKTNKDTESTAIVKQEEEDEKKKPKIEDEPPMKSDTPTGEPTKIERDKEFDDLVGDLAILNEDDGKSNLKESQVDDEVKSQDTKIAMLDSGESSDDSRLEYPERKSLHSSVSIPKSSSIDKTASIEAEKVNDTSNSSLKRMSNDNSSEETAPSAKRSKFSNDSDSEDDSSVKSISKPKLLSVVTVKTKPSEEVSSLASKEESQTKSKSDAKNETSSQRSSLNQSKSIDRRKPRTDDLRNESRRDNRHPIHNSSSEKSSRIEETRDKERLGSRSGTMKSRLGTNGNKKDVLSLKSTNSTKISKPRISNVKSRLGVRSKQQDRELLRTPSKLSKISQKHFEDEDDDAECVITTSLKSHIIAVQKAKKRKQTTSDALIKPKKIIQEEIIDEDEDQDDKVPSKVIVTPRPLQPLKPVQKRATQSLLLKAVAEANQSVVMQKKVDPCLKEQTKPTNKIKITRDPWEGKILSVSLNGKRRNVMEKIQVELNNPDKSKSKKSLSSKKSQVVTDDHMDVVKSLFKRSDNKQKFLVTLNGYNNNVLKEKNSDEEERVNVEVLEVEDDDDELSLINNPYDAYEDEVQIIENDDYSNDHPLGRDQEMRQEPSGACTNTHKDKYGDKYKDKQVEEYADKPVEQYTDKQANRHADTYKDKYADKYKDKQVDQYADKYTDKPAVQYPDKPAGQYSDKPAAQYTDKPAAQYSEKPAAQYSDEPDNQYSDIPVLEYFDRPDNHYYGIPAPQYSDRPATQYSDTPVNQYSDRPANQYTDKYSDNPAAQYTDKYTNRTAAHYTNKPVVQYVEPKINRNRIDNRDHLRVEQISGRNHRRPSPIVYSRSRSDSPANKPTVASTVTSVLRIKKRPLISSIITTVADKSNEKCRYWPTCTLGKKCAYLHPEVLCSSFPACKFGEKCAYMHPKCKFGSACTKLGCKFSHPPVKCKYHPYCMKPGCPFSHPKTSSSSKLAQGLTPNMTTVRAKFTWKKKE
ncbi:zinc finger CCCH domain-containing protein 14 [Nasonia vitripennis]|uniref:Zinc finger CCCH domain-containing protein 14 n=1 Tax=Nasonia vitripennis TaxID=7425 RepID=A0A7M7IYV6_NASVI|nr:zinc finger CCCH domain-containing protein 14 [Nasonia vitripennis]